MTSDAQEASCLGERALGAGWLWEEGPFDHGALLWGGWSLWDDNKPPPNGGIPDFRHHGTMGLLLSQVRRRYQNPNLYVAFEGNCWVVYTPGTSTPVCQADSEAEALVLALEQKRGE